MGLRIISVCMLLVFLLTLFPVVESKGIRPYYHQNGHFFHEPIWLYPYIDGETGEPSLRFAPNTHYIYYDEYDEFDPWGDIYGEWGRTVELEKNESITFRIAVPYRLYNPDIYWEFDLVRGISPWIMGPSEDINVTYELRFDSDGDKNPDYIVSAQDEPETQWLRHPTLIYGEPGNITEGIIELVVTRSDFQSGTYLMHCGLSNTNIQIPFDLDTDLDGLGDYSDPDDDNDGYSDEKDWFPQDPKEWKDTDRDGIGDNYDSDVNGNQIPDDLELPLALCILLIPVVIIGLLVKRKRGKPGDEKVNESEKLKMTDSGSGPKNW